ncbi:hypothetical protein [Streptomyces sp. CC228A]|uniref:hypothetical protein n=1 Tax=Streptomyces sp. CC228A TaxID=2898186 RepID=UPI001F3DD8EE|nr:hypothetical protein [Streptomyces sp. CC228A]
MTRKRLGWLVGAGALLLALVLTLPLHIGQLLPGKSDHVPDAPGQGLPEALEQLRGDNDLVRPQAVAHGARPRLHSTAYGRQETRLSDGTTAMPALDDKALIALAESDATESPAWRAYYLCLAVAPRDPGAPSPHAQRLMDQIPWSKEALEEARTYLITRGSTDSIDTSVATRGSFLTALRCLGKADGVPESALDALATDANRISTPIPVLEASDALSGLGRPLKPSTAVSDWHSEATAQSCTEADAAQLAAQRILSPATRLPQESAQCLKAGIGSDNPQTRWLARRALPQEKSIKTRAAFDDKGLVIETPNQQGNLRATYEAARALAITGTQNQAPDWLTDAVRKLSNERELPPGDNVMVALICDRLELACGPRAAEGQRDVAALVVPPRYQANRSAQWGDTMRARIELELGCPKTDIAPALPEGKRLDGPALRALRLLGEAGCKEQAAQAVTGHDLPKIATGLLRDGDLIGAADAYWAAVHSGAVISQEFFDQLPSLVAKFTAKGNASLYSRTPGGPADVEATNAAYSLQ